MLVLMPSAPPAPGYTVLAPGFRLVSCTFKVRRKASAAASGERYLGSPDGLDAVSRQGADLSRLSPGPDGTSRSATDAPGAPRSCHRRRDHPDRRAGEARAGGERRFPAGGSRRPAPAPGHTRATPAPQGAGIAASAPRPGGPLAEVEVPERVVDPGRLPVDDAGQPAAISQQLTIVNVAVDQDRAQLGGAGQQVRPYRGTSGPAREDPPPQRPRRRWQPGPEPAAASDDAAASW